LEKSETLSTPITKPNSNEDLLDEAVNLTATAVSIPSTASSLLAAARVYKTLEDSTGSVWQVASKKRTHMIQFNLDETTTVDQVSLEKELCVEQVTCNSKYMAMIVIHGRTSKRDILVHDFANGSEYSIEFPNASCIKLLTAHVQLLAIGGKHGLHFFDLSKWKSSDLGH
jgi:hypothetical protein